MLIYSFTNASSERNIERHNTMHGGLNPEVTNVIFTQGELDPWRSIGVQEDLNPDAPAFIINGIFNIFVSQNIPIDFISFSRRISSKRLRTNYRE